MKIDLSPIGYVHSTRTDPVDDHWDSETSYIELTDSFTAEALLGLDQFSHIEVVFYMHRVDSAEIETRSRHPRGRTDWPRVGVFAQRNYKRPNRLGLTVARVKSIDGTRIHVDGLDAIDGAPVLDIKPWVAEFAPRGPLAQPDWVTELMQHYWR